MLVSIFNDHQLFLDLDVLSKLKKSKAISVCDNNLISKRGDVTVAFGILNQKLPNGTYSFEKLNSNEIEFNLISDTVSIQKPNVDWNAVSECKKLQCTPVIVDVLSDLIGRKFSTTVARIIKNRRMGREVMFFNLKDAFLINSDNINILVDRGSETCDKLIQGMPSDLAESLSAEASRIGTTVNTIIISKLHSGVKKPMAPAAPVVRKMNKMLQGIPVTHASILAEQAAVMGISVNALMLRLIEKQIEIPIAPAVPFTVEEKHTKLITGIPPALMSDIKTRAGKAGISVNKYILEVLSHE